MRTPDVRYGTYVGSFIFQYERVAMKALILNSGMGRRMGEITNNLPKCLVQLNDKETILSRQLHQLSEIGIEEVIITTGYKSDELVSYCNNLNLSIDIKYIFNEKYSETNYIYSMYLAREELDDDIVLMHGDLVFENVVLDKVAFSKDSCVVVSSTSDLPEKDFKAVLLDGRVRKISINDFDRAIALQPLYKLAKKDIKTWIKEIEKFCEAGNTSCYAEDAFNECSDQINIKPIDIKRFICKEVDNAEDLAAIKDTLLSLPCRNVYMCFSTDIVHSGHLSIIKRAKRLGKVTIGVLSDEAISKYKRFPLLPYSERKEMFENIQGVDRVVCQDKLSYKENLVKYKPEIVVHGDDWVQGIQQNIRTEVIDLIQTYGGELVEYPYSDKPQYREYEKRARQMLGTSDMRRARLCRALESKNSVIAMEAHNGLTGLLVENTKVEENGGIRQFDAMWVSSLCDSTSKGKPDIEVVDLTSRLQTINEICEVTTKPIIFDGDTGGLSEHFSYTVRTLERMGVSMVIIEDKKGLKKNSLFGNEVEQTQCTIEEFCMKIAAGKKAQKTDDFMICARIESLILEKGMEDALNRAFAFRDAGADAIMIHSRKKDPKEIFEFAEAFRKEDTATPLVVVPTSFNEVTDEQLEAVGFNIIIYANHFTRAEVPAMQKVAETILKNHRSKECDDLCMPFKEIIRLIPDET